MVSCVGFFRYKIYLGFKFLDHSILWFLLNYSPVLFWQNIKFSWFTILNILSKFWKLISWCHFIETFQLKMNSIFRPMSCKRWSSTSVRWLACWAFCSSSSGFSPTWPRMILNPRIHCLLGNIFSEIINFEG